MRLFSGPGDAPEAELPGGDAVQAAAINSAPRRYRSSFAQNEPSTYRARDDNYNI
jgi:hypothetical protein